MNLLTSFSAPCLSLRDTAAAGGDSPEQETCCNCRSGHAREKLVRMLVQHTRRWDEKPAVIKRRDVNMEIVVHIFRLPLLEDVHSVAMLFA